MSETAGRPSRPQAVTAALLAVLITSVSCSSAPKTERLPSQTMSGSPAQASDPAQPAEEAPNSPLDGRETVQGDSSLERPGSVDRGLTVVIDEGEGPDGRRRTLVEAAAAERERRKSTGEQIAVITNDNLKDYATGQLTESGTSSRERRSDAAQGSGSEEAAAADAGDAGNGPAGSFEAEGDAEAYWRGRVLQARMDWAAAVEEIAHLDSRIAELRQRFYAEEDPYYRDSRIKPSWDRAIDRLEEARAASERHRKEVQSILEEGRQAAALPGWLREGLELEPDVADGETTGGSRTPGSYEPGEPKIASDPDGAR